MKRRSFLKGTLASSTIAVAASAGLLTPRHVLAAWPESAFEAENIEDAMSNLFGTADNKAADSINIKAPDIAENGAVVPVTVSTTIKGVSAIAIIAEKNGTPLAANFELTSNAQAMISTQNGRAAGRERV